MTADIVRKIFVENWPYWFGGALIGLLVPLLYYYFNTALGVSTGYGNLVKIFLPSKKLQWIQSKFGETLSWRVHFIGGIIIGGLISSILSGNLGFSTEMGRFTAIAGWPSLLNAAFFFAGGIMLGLGARIAGGCTSGHSIHGIANLHISSILATIFFIIGGIISANIVRSLILGGAWQ